MLESADTRADRGRARGAWYADPYGAPGQERWYDGGKWTAQVREAAADAPHPAARLRPRPAHAAKSTGSPPVQTPAQPAGPVAPASREPTSRETTTRAPASREPAKAGAFPVRLSHSIGEPIELVRLGRRHASEHELVAEPGRVASLRLHGPSKLATVSCEEGSWSLTKEGRSGWRLRIRAADGSHIGSYEPRRWLPGGTIAVGDAMQVELGRVAWSRWSLHLPGAGEKLASISAGRRMGGINPWVTVHWLPSAQDEFSLIVLVGCAVVMLGGAGPVGPDSIGQ